MKPAQTKFFFYVKKLRIIRTSMNYKNIVNCISIIHWNRIESIYVNINKLKAISLIVSLKTQLARYNGAEFRYLKSCCAR